MFKTNTGSRPDKYRNLCSSVPSIGVRATVPYFRRGKSFKQDLESLSEQFAQKYGKNYKYVLTLSGGIDSEVTAETFYQMGFRFRVSHKDCSKELMTMILCMPRNIVKIVKVEHEIIDLSEDKLLRRNNSRWCKTRTVYTFILSNCTYKHVQLHSKMITRY